MGEVGESDFFYFESKFKIKNNVFGGVAGVGGGLAGEARVSEFFFTKNPNLNFFCGGGGGGAGRWMDSRTGPNQFVP